MEKIIAILTQKGALSKGLQENTTINLFKLENEKVTEVENISLENTSENHFSLLMALKKVSMIYIGTISNDLRNILNKIGIATKSKDEHSDDRFINQFIFD
jgi:hypothetical protein